MDENEPIQPLQQMQVEDYTDPSWEPEPIDAGPGECPYPLCRACGLCADGAVVRGWQISGRTSRAT